MYTEQFQKAIEAGEKVTENANYSLAPNFDNNFNIETENNPELLFSMQYKDGWTTDNTPQIYTTPRPWGGWDFREPIQDLIDEFETDDPRLDYTVFKVGDMVDLAVTKVYRTTLQIFHKRAITSVSMLHGDHREA